MNEHHLLLYMCRQLGPSQVIIITLLSHPGDWASCDADRKFPNFETIHKRMSSLAVIHIVTIITRQTRQTHQGACQCPVTSMEVVK